MKTLFKVLLITAIAVFQLPVLGMQAFAKRAAQAMVKKMNQPSLVQQTYKRDQYNNRQKYDHAKKASSKFNYDWKKLSYQSPFKNWFSMSALAASVSLSTSDSQSDSDTDQLQKENLLSLLQDVCDDNYSMLQARALRLIQNNPEWVAQQLEIILNNYDKVKQFIWLLKNHECCVTLISKTLTKNYELVVQSPYFKDFFQSILTLNHLYKEIPELKDLKTKLIKRYFLQKAEELKDEIANCKYSPTMAHLINSDVHTALSEYVTDEQLNTLAKKIISKEIELNKQGYYTFVHGQRWNYQLPEEWFTKLWKVTQLKEAENFIFAHVKPLPTDKENERETRERIVHAIRAIPTIPQKRTLSFDDFRAMITDENRRKNDRDRILFMNAGLFYNETYAVSNTASYIQNNANVNDHIILDFKKVFDFHEIKHLYNKYENELNTLEKEHQQLSKYGNTLLIAIPEEKVNDVAFIAHPYGLKKKLNIDGIGETSDMRLIMETLRTNPNKIADFDYNEFCLLMTADKNGGLNPESGIKYFQFNTVEEKQWEAFKEKERALFNKIAQEVRLEKSEEHYKKTEEKYAKFKRETAEHTNKIKEHLYFASQLADK